MATTASTGKRLLPQQVIAVVHHFTLNDAGWWQRSIDRLVLASLWLLDRPLSLTQIISCVKEQIEIDVGPSEIEASLQRQIRSGNIAVGDGKSYVLAEHQRNVFTASVEVLATAEQTVKARFVKSATSANIPTPSELWDQFREQALLPMIQMVGAKIYQYVKGRDWSIFANSKVDHFLRKQADLQSTIAKCIAETLDPVHDDARQMILSYLSASYCISSARLDRQTLDTLITHRQRRPRFRVMLDTNFLYSFLSLHDNPSNDAACRLHDLIADIQNKVDIKFYVTPLTLDEAKIALESHKERIKRIHTTPYVRAILGDYTSGVALQFYKTTGANPTIEDIERYFSPYISDLMAVLRSRDIECYNEDMSHLDTDSNVIADIEMWMKLQENRVGAAKRPRSYEQVRHDVALWHFAHRKRRARVESPLDAEVWIATIDFTFLKFDARKTRRLKALPVCVHPSTLVQILQFWVPRSPALDKALVDSIRLPLLAIGFDADAERITLEILGTLSSFENADHLSVEAVETIVTDGGLREQIIKSRREGDKIKLVKDVFVKRNVEMAAKLKEMNEVAGSTRREISELQKESTAKAEELGKSQAVVVGLKGRVEALEKEIELEKKRREIGHERKQFVRVGVIRLVIVMCGVIGIAMLERLRFNAPIWPSIIGYAVCGGALWLGVVVLEARRIVTVKNWGPIKNVSDLLVAIAVAVFMMAPVALFHSWLFEWWKAMVPRMFPHEVEVNTRREQSQIDIQEEGSKSK